MNNLPLASMDKIIPGEDYPFRIDLRGADVPSENNYIFIIRADVGCDSPFKLPVTAAPLAAIAAKDEADGLPAIEARPAGKAITGIIPGTVTANWRGKVTWILVLEDKKPFIGGRTSTEFEGMIVN